jgi:hypothetical protein
VNAEHIGPIAAGSDLHAFDYGMWQGDLIAEGRYSQTFAAGLRRKGQPALAGTGAGSHADMAGAISAQVGETPRSGA